MRLTVSETFSRASSFQISSGFSWVPETKEGTRYIDELATAMCYTNKIIAFKCYKHYYNVFESFRQIEYV